MKIIEIEGNVFYKVVVAIGRAEMFGSLNKESLTQCAKQAELIQYGPNDIVFLENDPSDSFFIIIKGEVAILHGNPSSEEMIELGRIKPVNVIGEIGLLFNAPRSATVRAVKKETMLLKFDKERFQSMFAEIPDFAPAISRNLGERVRQLSKQIPLPAHDKNTPPPTSETIKMIPIDFIIQHRILPLQVECNIIYIGFVNDPTSSALNSVRRFVPGMELRMVHIENEYFDEVLKDQAGINNRDCSSSTIR